MNAYAYFKSHDNYFWHWEEEGEVIAIPGGNTIAYKKYIIEVLHDFTGQGFPPFGTLLMLLIALSINGAASLNSVYSILNKELDEQNKIILDEAMGFLKLLTKIPAKYKMGGGRMNLLQSVFNEFKHRILSPKSSEKIFEAFTSGKMHVRQLLTKSPMVPRVFYGDFRVLGLLAGKFKSVDDILATLNSLPGIPEELEIVNEPKEEPEEKDLIEELIEDEKTFRVGTLIKRIWSGLNIPVHSALPSTQPLGGVSDLTNKGTFDRLLISEFANDDLLFLSRIANNEALYIHREIPPVSNNLQRIILVDISLKNWGTPKIIAYAIALAIAKHPKTDIACTAFAFGNSFYPLALDTVDNIVDGLQLLENGLHGAQGLEAFFKEYPDNKNREIFLITAASTLNQIAMVKALNDYFSAISYWIHTDAEGNIDLYRKQQKSKKHVQHMQLALEELWVRKTKKKVQKSVQKITDLYPLLFVNKVFANSDDYSRVLSTSDNEIFYITKEKAVLRLYDKQNMATYSGNGWELIYENLPFSHGEYEMGLNEDGDYILLAFNTNNKKLVLINITTGFQWSIPFPEWVPGLPKSFVYYQYKFYHITKASGWSIYFNNEYQSAQSGTDKIIIKKLEDETYTELLRKEIVNNRIESLKNLLSYEGYFTGNILKNLRNVSITEANNLIWNSYELKLNKYYQGSYFQVTNLGRSKEIVKAKNIGENKFEFKDGSIVEMNRHGMIILKSSNNEIPIIYIPSILMYATSLATAREFSGDNYYHKKPQFEVRLVAIPRDIERIIVRIKDVTKIDLKTIRELIQSLPATLIKKTSENSAEQLKNLLEKEGATIEISPLEYPDGYILDKIDEELFLKKYLEPFINNILSYETKH